MKQSDDVFDEVFGQAVELGNRMSADEGEADLWDVADGLLAGAIQFWLYSRQPCGDPRCEECAPYSTAEGRLGELMRLAKESAEDSEYYHSPTDANAGRA